MTDTIAAISTAMGEGGIGIVRLSGKDSISIGSKIFRSIDSVSLEDKENRKLNYGHIVDSHGNLVDEVLIALLKGPSTYTREDMVEIYCHGGIVPVRKILNLCLENGARLAESGEFTKKAFLNGRLDLSQAEAVMDLINAKTDKSYELSLGQLEGGLSQKVKDMRNQLLSMLAHIEASIDFPDEDLETSNYEDLKEGLRELRLELIKLIETSERGKILRDGISTLILGRPNVGKSSLLNAILRENRAIVTDIPGTTRDLIEEYVNLDGIALKLVDTAGIRMTDDLVEKIGVDRAKELVDSADLIIGVFDRSQELSQDDFDIAGILREKKSIALINKTDLDPLWDEEDLRKLLPKEPIISGAIAQGQGLDLLEDSIKDMFYQGDLNLDSGLIVNNLRHKNQLEKALRNVEEGLEALESGLPLDCIEVDVKDCWDNLGEISGDTIGEDILDKIFSEFCIGK